MIEFKGLILIGAALFAAGLFVGTKLRGRRRLWVILPVLLLSGLLVYVALGIREDKRRAEEIFSRLDVQTDLMPPEANALRMLSGSSHRIREATLRSAFSNPINASLALPRLEFLLESALQLDPDGKQRRRLWDRVVQPALKRQSSTEVLLLAAGVADVLRLGSNEVGQVTRPLLSALEQESKEQLRFQAACVLVSMATRIPSEQAEPVSRFLVREAQAITNLDRGDGVINLRRIGVLANGLARLTNQPGADTVQPVIAQVVAEMERETNTMRLAKLGSELGLFKTNLKADDAQRALRCLIQAMADRRPPYIVPELGDAALPLVGNLTAEQSEPLAEQIVSEMSREGELFRLDLFVKPLVPLASQLGPEANARFVQRVVDAMTHGASQEALRKFSGAVTSAVERITAGQAGPLAEQLLARLFKEQNYVTRAPMISVFAALLARVGPQQAKQFSDRLESGLAIVLTRGDPSELEEQVNCLAAAACRLDREPAREFAERLVVVMEEHKDHTLVLAGLLVAVEPHLTEDIRERAVRGLVSATEGPATVVQLTAFLQRLERLQAPPTPEEHAAIVERIVRAMEKSPEAGSLTPLMKHVAPLMGSLNSDQARRLGESMLLAAQDPRSAVLAFDALRDFSAKLDQDQLKRAVDLVMTRIKTSDPATTSWLLRALKPFAGGLESDQASSLMDQLLTVMEKQGYTVTTMGIAANLPVVGDRLDRAQSRLAAERITVALEDTADSLSLGSLKGMQRHSKLTEGLPPYSILVARTESTTDSWRFAVLCRALSGLLAKLQKDEAEVLGRRIAARFEKQGWHAPLMFGETMPLVLQYAPEQSLMDILKAPFAVGGLRQAVLRAWELKTGRTFDDNLRGFVSWAATEESLKGLQLGNTPVSRYVPDL